MKFIKCYDNFDTVEYIPLKRVVMITIEWGTDFNQKGDEVKGYTIYITHKQDGGEYVKSINENPVKYKWLAKLLLWFRINF